MLTATIVALLTLPCSHAVGHVVAADLSPNERPYLGFSLEDLSFWDRVRVVSVLLTSLRACACPKGN